MCVRCVSSLDVPWPPGEVLSESELARIERSFTDGEPYLTLSERAYVADSRRLLAEVRRLRALGGTLLDGGPSPVVDRAGRVDYGAPVPRATWRRDLPPAPIDPAVTKGPYRHQSAQVRG